MHCARQPHHHRFLRRSGSVRSAVLVAVSLAVALFAGLLTQSSASATTVAPAAKAAKAGTPKGGTNGQSGNTEVQQITIDLAAWPLDNLCNTDVVNLHGTATITTRTTARSDGSYAVQSVFAARGLTGERIFPAPSYGYVGDQVDDTYSYTAPPNTTVTVVHYVKLIPQAPAPAMWLVVVTHEVITPDGTVPTPDRVYLSCTKPSSHRSGDGGHDGGDD